MSTLILHVYPLWKCLKTLQIREPITHDEMTHWITFWMCSFMLMNLPFPSSIQWMCTTILYFPDSTNTIREIMLKNIPQIPSTSNAIFKQLVYKLKAHLLKAMTEDSDSTSLNDTFE